MLLKCKQTHAALAPWGTHCTIGHKRGTGRPLITPQPVKNQYPICCESLLRRAVAFLPGGARSDELDAILSVKTLKREGGVERIADVAGIIQK